MFKSMATIQSFLLLATLQVSSVYGHGYIFEPESRNMRAFRESKEFCPHCLNRDGGGGAVAPGDRRYQVDGEDDTGEIAATYVEGQVIQVKTKIMENHKGFWRLAICDRRDFTDSCFAQHILKTVASSPWSDPTGTWTYINVNAQDTVVTTPYKLPMGLTCTHCVMQWTWISGNSCRPSGMDVNYVESYSVNLDVCGPNYASPSELIPEKFWNVVDIRINPASGGSPAASQVKKSSVSMGGNMNGSGGMSGGMNDGMDGGMSGSMDQDVEYDEEDMSDDMDGPMEYEMEDMNNGGMEETMEEEMEYDMDEDMSGNMGGDMNGGMSRSMDAGMGGMKGQSMDRAEAFEREEAMTGGNMMPMKGQGMEKMAGDRMQPMNGRGSNMMQGPGRMRQQGGGRMQGRMRKQGAGRMQNRGQGRMQANRGMGGSKQMRRAQGGVSRKAGLTRRTSGKATRRSNMPTPMMRTRMMRQHRKAQYA